MSEITPKVTVVAQGDTVTILTGQAPDPINPEKLTIEGNIFAVEDFLNVRDVDPKNSIITFDEAKRTITLIVDEHSPVGTKVVARLDVYPELDDFGINKGKKFDNETLAQHLKKNRIWFTDKDNLPHVIKGLQDFKAKVTSEIQRSNDNRGNSTNAVKKQLTSDNIPAEFKLTMPIFKGMPENTFLVEVLVDTTDSSVRFWLESVELYELQKSAVLNAFKGAKERLKNKGLPMISI